MVIWNRNHPAADQPTRVLIIDSDPLVRSVLETAIGALGDYEIATAADGESGLEKIESMRPQCVLVDLLVPGIDGFTLLARMRRGKRRPDRVIVSSGVMDSSMAPDLKALGADAVLPRPFRIDDLAEALGQRQKQPAHQFVAYLN